MTHCSLAEIIATFPDDIVNPTLEYPGVKELIDADSIEDAALKTAFLKRMA
jgi:hypothetical protein